MTVEQEAASKKSESPARAARAGSGAAPVDVELRVAHLDCEHDAAAIRRGLAEVKGLDDVEVFAKAGKVRLRYDPSATSVPDLARHLSEIGFPPQREADLGPPAPWRNPKVVASVASGVLLAAGWMAEQLGLSSMPTTIVLLLGSVTGGYYFGREAFEDLVFERRVGIELLMALAAILATALGEAIEGTMLVFLYSISEAAEGYAEAKTRSAVRALMDLTPKRALVRRNGIEREMPIEELLVGDIFIVKPGESFPTDGTIVVGESGIDQSPVTGESIPVDKGPGASVFAGSINGEAVLEVEATKVASDHTVARIIHLVEAAQEKKGKSQRFIERFGSRYSPAVLLVGLAVAILPPLLAGAAWTTWILRATVFIVAAAPCALVISVPITLVAALGTAARRGILVKGGVFIEALAQVRIVAFDKTGTITTGEPYVAHVELLPASDGADADSVLALAAAVEARSQHPLARAIVQHALARGIDVPAVAEGRSLTGSGATGIVQGRHVQVGSPSFVERQLGVDLAGAREVIGRLQGEGSTTVVVCDGSRPVALIGVRDQARPNARQAIVALRADGVDTVVMLTGDNECTANAIAREVGVDRVFADLSPEQKADRVTAMMTEGAVAMVGDGVNDAPALAAATVGVAMGAAGTDVALESADVALMADDLGKLDEALRIARRTRRVVRQNLALSAVVISALVVGAVAGAFSLPVAVIVHELSEFVVIANGLRMLRA